MDIFTMNANFAILGMKLFLYGFIGTSILLVIVFLYFLIEDKFFS